MLNLAEPLASYSQFQLLFFLHSVGIAERLDFIYKTIIIDI